MELCLGRGLESEQSEDWRQKQSGCYDREDDLEKDVETFRGEELEIFVSSLAPLLMAAKDALSVFVRIRLDSVVGGNRTRGNTE